MLDDSAARAAAAESTNPERLLFRRFPRTGVGLVQVEGGESPADFANLRLFPV